MRHMGHMLGIWHDTLPGNTDYVGLLVKVFFLGGGLADFERYELP